MNKSRKLGRILSVIVLLGSTFFQAKAQNPTNYYIEVPKTFSGGLVGGATFCQVDGDKFAGYFKIGVNAGAILYARLSNSFSVSMELLYTQKGSKSNYNQNSSSNKLTVTDQRINLSYAEIPILLNIYDKHKSHVGMGFSYAQLINADETIKTSPVITYDQNQYPFKKSDINFIASANLHLVKGLYANLRFQYSVVPVRKTVDYEFARSQQYNNMWVLRVMYLF
jgi:hypothetical protein